VYVCLQGLVGCVKGNFDSFSCFWVDRTNLHSYAKYYWTENVFWDNLKQLGVS